MKFRKRLLASILSIFMIGGFCSAPLIAAAESPKEEPVILEEVVEAMQPPIVEEAIEEVIDETVEEPGEIFTDDEIKLIALVTMAEAEGECEYGKRLVIDTVLNRIDHVKFPSSPYDVIYQKNQFTSMTNGRANRCSINDYVVNLVREEIASRTNYEVLFFRSGHYHNFGTPLLRVENHYFSTY